MQNPILCLMAALGMALSACAAQGRLAGIRSYAVYYGTNQEYASRLSEYDLGIVQPNTLPLAKIKALRQQGNILVAYISVGEADGPSLGLPKNWVLGQNKNWGSTYVDANQPGWQDRILERAHDIVSFGFDGFFLDTLDTVDLYPKTKPGMVRIVQRLREAFPKAVMVQNRGFAVLKETVSLVDAVMFEDYSTGFDFAAQRYLAKDKPATDVLPYRHRTTILALDYATDPNIARHATSRAHAAGFVPFVSTIALNTLEHRGETPKAQP